MRRRREEMVEEEMVEEEMVEEEMVELIRIMRCTCTHLMNR